MYKTLGILNLLLVVLLTSAYWLPRLNNATLRLRSKGYFGVLRALRALHKPLGVLLLLSAAVHGCLALGSLRPHTGTLTFLIVFLTAALGGSYFRTKKPILLRGHRTAAFVFVLVVLLHLLFPNALSFLY